MQNWIIEIMNQYGYFGILFLIAIENVFPPIPSEVILTFGGFMTTYTTMNPWGVIVFATLGSVLGAIILYGVGRIFSPERLESWLSGRLGKLLHLKSEDILKAQGWFEKKGKLTVFFCRFIPIVRSLISIPAGMARMNMWIFLFLTTIGTAIWNIVLVFLGVFAGASWERIVSYMDTYSLIAVVVIGIIVLVVGFIFVKKRFLGKTAD